MTINLTAVRRKSN